MLPSFSLFLRKKRVGSCPAFLLMERTLFLLISSLLWPPAAPSCCSQESFFSQEQHFEGAAGQDPTKDLHQHWSLLLHSFPTNQKMFDNLIYDWLIYSTQLFYLCFYDVVSVSAWRLKTDTKSKMTTQGFIRINWWNNPIIYQRSLYANLANKLFQKLRLGLWWIFL